MKAIVRSTYGPPDVLKLQEIDMPEPGPGQVRVEVVAVAVNPLDWHVLRGDPFLVRLMGFGLLKPKHRVLGADVAGRVDAVGSDVTRFNVGDEVFGSSLGGFAEYACMREQVLVPKPAAVTFEQAAAVPIAALTALQGLRDHGGMQPGHDVLVNGASGGVGTFAVQIARALGARVTGVCSGRNVELVRSIGADAVIDYTQEDFGEQCGKFDVILDAAAFGPVRRAVRALKPAGTYVMVGGSTSGFLGTMLMQMLYSRKGGRKVKSMMTKIMQADLEFLQEMLGDGRIVPVIDRTYPLSETADAVRYVEGGHARGKVIIAVRS